MVSFLTEISFRAEIKPLPSPAPDFSRTLPVTAAPSSEKTGIYYLDISPPPANTYWTAWGGYYDEYTGTQIELYYGQFLLHVGTADELKTIPFSLYIDTSTYKFYFNIPIHPWLYSDYASEGEEVVPFISSALNPDNPSRNEIRGVPAQTRLEIPNFSVKLSDSVSGITLNQAFDVVLHNDDGYFDDDDKWGLFNTPVHLKKAVVENPQYDDFKEIRGGNAGSTSTSFDTFRINVSDKLRNMDDPVCKTIQPIDFPSVELSDDAIGKNIPVVYGVKKLKPIKIWQQTSAGNVTAARYLLAEYASAAAAYNKDGAYMGTDGLLLEDNQILYNTKLGADGKLIEVAEVVITGYAESKIGEIIKHVVSSKTKIVYTSANWNIGEVNAYIAVSSPINIAFTSGSVKKAVSDALSSDMAYFIQQTDGRFTLRKYGQTYGNHSIPAWTLTQKPEKNYDAAQNNYFSSCSIKYNFTETDNDTFSLYFYGDLENAAEDRYRKKVFKEYETDLKTEADAAALAALLGQRYTTMRQRVKIAVGMDTYGMELLDTVSVDMTVNDREFSAAERFIITEINPAQDILTLEEIE